MNIWKYLFFSLFLISLIGCSTDDDKELIDPTDVDALTEVLILPDGTSQNQGETPSPSNTVEAPVVDNLTNSLISSNGSTAILNYRYSNLSSNLGGCYAQINGAGRYFTIPYAAASSSSGTLQLPLGIPTNVDEGEFCVTFSVYDQQGRISNLVSSCVNVLRLGTGSLQVSLSWDNDTDQDLYVVDPFGEEIYYSHPFSQTGGQLDRDDVDGFGPENIFWLNDAPDGSYLVKVNDYEDNGTVANFFVTVSGPNVSRNFNGSTQNGNTVDVISFTKRGDQISF